MDLLFFGLSILSQRYSNDTFIHLFFLYKTLYSSTCTNSKYSGYGTPDIHLARNLPQCLPRTRANFMAGFSPSHFTMNQTSSMTTTPTNFPVLAAHQGDQDVQGRERVPFLATAFAMFSIFLFVYSCSSQQE